MCQEDDDDRARRTKLGLDPDCKEGRRAMTRHQVDPTECSSVDSDGLACWLLFYLEAHGAEIVLRPDRSVNVNLDPMMGSTQ